MKSIYYFFFAIFLIPSLSHSQSNYKAGYIVSLNGDTINGYINYKEWDNSPASISFRKDLKQPKSEMLTAKNARAFAIIGQLYYERYIVSVSQDPIELNTLMPAVDTTCKIDTVFLRVLNKGKHATLFGYKDDLKGRFYLLEAGQSIPYELTYHAYYNKDQSEEVQYIKRFRTQLRDLAQKAGLSNERLTRIIAQSNYTESDMTKILREINGSTSKQFTTPRLFGTRFFAGGGVNYTQSKFTGVANFATSPASKNAFPKIDAGVDFLINKDIQKFYLRAEVSLTINGPYKFITTDVGPALGTATLKYKQYNASLTPQFVYNLYNKDNLKVFIDAGVSINMAAYGDYKTVTVYDSFPAVVQDRYPEFVKNYFSFPLKAGAAVNKRVEIYVGYIPTTTISNFINTKNAITTYSAGINYLFK